MTSGRLPGATVPEVLAVEAAGPDGGDAGGYLVMTECPRDPWPNVDPLPAGQERDALRAELGRQVARLHTIAGTGFGYPSAALGPLRASWREAFGAMVDAVLADAARAFWGDPLADFVSLGLFHDIEQTPRSCADTATRAERSPSAPPNVSASRSTAPTCT